VHYKRKKPEARSQKMLSAPSGFQPRVKRVLLKVEAEGRQLMADIVLNADH